MNRHAVPVHAAGAGGLAQGGAHPAGEFGEIVGLGQPGQGLPPVAVPDLVVPFGDQVVQRAAAEHPAEIGAGLAEGHAAVHAPGRLLPPLGKLQRRMEFLKILMYFIIKI